MANNNEPTTHDSVPRLTIIIDGPYFALEKFRKVLENFSIVLSEIDRETSDIGQIDVELSISEVRQGSICLTAEANIINDRVKPEKPYEIIEAFKSGFESIKDSPIRPNNFTTRALKNINGITDLIDPHDFAEISFSDAQWRIYLNQNISVHIDEITRSFYGLIEGKDVFAAYKASLGLVWA